MFSVPTKFYTQQDFWDMLPLSKTQREKIIKDFIETGEYDKIEDEEVIDQKADKEEVKVQVKIEDNEEGGKDIDINIEVPKS